MIRSAVPVCLLVVTSLALGHPRHAEREDVRPFAKYILPRDVAEICDHTLSPALANFYGDDVLGDARRAWIAEQRSRGDAGLGVTHRGKTAYSAQMHIHGSMSEGTGSMETQTYEAWNAGVDILWWSDHDHRITYHHHVSTFGFEDWCEFWVNNEPWTPTLQFEVNKYKSINRPTFSDDIYQPCNVMYVAPEFASTAADFSEDHAFEGARSLRLEVTAEEGDFTYREWPWQMYSDGRQSWRRSLASEVTLHLAILPSVISPDARPMIRVELSDHLFPTPPEDPEPFEFRQLTLVYYLSNTETEPVLDGAEYRVPLAYVRDWNAYALDITADVQAAFELIDGEEAFPYIEAGDNSAHRIFFGMEARNGARGEAFFDALRIEDVVRGDALLDEQRAMADRFEARVPEVHQLHGTELSLTAPQHLTEFSENLELPDYEELARESPWWDEGLGMVSDQQAFKEWLFAELVRRAHARGGVVSYNHMWGGGLNLTSNQEMLDRLIANNAYGCDILEVGYRDRHAHQLPDYLWVWDELQRAGIYILGNGASDLHGPTPGQWLTHGQNLVTWIFADSLSEADLINGLKGGRLYFGDPRLFPDGMMDIMSDRGHGMGRIVQTDRDTASVSLELHGADNPDEVRVIVDGDLAATHTASEFDPYLAVPEFSIGEAGSFVRFELYRNNGQDKGFSNHLHFVRSLPASGVSHQRAAFDMAGVHTMDVDALTLMDVSRLDMCHATILRIEVHTHQADGSTGSDGWLMLDTGSRGIPDGVEVVNLGGTWSTNHNLMTFDGLSGAGIIELRWGCPADATGDGLVDFDDLNVVLQEWGKIAACDLTGDGEFGFDDLNEVLSYFGTDCEGGR